MSLGLKSLRNLSEGDFDQNESLALGLFTLYCCCKEEGAAWGIKRVLVPDDSSH